MNKTDYANIEDFREEYIYNNKYNDIISTGIGLDENGEIEFRITIATDNDSLKRKALIELSKELPISYNGTNIKITCSSAIIAYT